MISESQLCIHPPMALKTLQKALREPTISPAAAYLKSLGSTVSRRTMVSALNRAASIIDPHFLGKEAWKNVPWNVSV